MVSTMAQKKPTFKNTWLIEYCCGPKSKLSEHWTKSGGQARRVCLEEQLDARDRRTKEYLARECRARMRKGQHVRLHVSLPCAPWSKLSRMTASTSKDRSEARERRQAESRKMLRLVIELIKELQGSHFGCSFEWPDNCDGFNLTLCPEMRTLMKLLPCEARCHGCAFGLKDQQGVPIKKPWRVLPNCKDIAMMERKCPGHPAHKSLAPGNAKLARETENYPIQFVKTLAQCL